MPISQCVHMVTSIRSLGLIYCIITLDGGSVMDAGKLARFTLANAAYKEEHLNTLWGAKSYDPAKLALRDIKRPTIPLLVFPPPWLTASMGIFLGLLRTISRAKRVFDPGVNPTLVIQDLELCAMRRRNRFGCAQVLGWWTIVSSRYAPY